MQKLFEIIGIIIDEVKPLIIGKFWGKLEITFEDGMPIHWANKTTGRFKKL